MSNIETTIRELHRLFNFLNDRFFGGELPEPSILVQTNGKRKGVMGWCTTKPIWSDKERTVKKHELTVCSEYLNINTEDIIATMLHEMVHLYCSINEIKDCTRGGTYHNKRFKQEAEARGLTVEYHEKVGWGLDKLSDQGRETIKDFHLNQDAFKMARLSREIKHQEEGAEDGEGEGEEESIGNSEGKKGSMRKYICPNCETIIRATKEVNVMCADCNVLFEQEERE